MPRLPWDTRSGVKPLGQLLGTRVPLGCLRSSCRGAEVGTGRVGGAEWGRSPDLCVHLGWGDKVLSVTGFDPPSLHPHASPVCTGRSGNRPPPHLLSHHLSCPSSSPTPTRFHLHLRRNHLSTHRAQSLALASPQARAALSCVFSSAWGWDGRSAPPAPSLYSVAPTAADEGHQVVFVFVCPAGVTGITLLLLDLLVRVLQNR